MKVTRRRVVVPGAGGAGLTAAIAAHGATASSGGMIWIPNKHHE